ncbi:MAG: ATP-binding protein [Burkholderiaceae bacterium]
MSRKLPINLTDLLRQRTIEGERIEYKTGWNPDAIIRTLCAFANDFENLGGGYVVIGQDCDANGQPMFPPVGLAESRLDKIQQELLAACQLIQPPYFPVLSIEEVEGRKLIVLWAPGGQNRPYKAPEAVTTNKKTWRYYIRRYSSSVEAKGETEQELLSLAAKVPFDVSAKVILTHCAKVKVTHLGHDDGFLGAVDVDPGGRSGDARDGPKGRIGKSHSQGAWVFAQHRAKVSA